MADNTHSTPVSPNTTDRLKALRDLADSHVGKTLRWYSNHTRLPRILFRAFGSAAIVLSISLPFFVTARFVGEELRELLVSSIALAVALLSAFSTFFRWDQSWRTNMQAKLALENLLASWELDVLEAQGQVGSDKQVEAAFLATRGLFDKAAKVDTLNTEGYFTNVAFPSTTTTKPPVARSGADDAPVR
jgi:hypothetical protein